MAFTSRDTLCSDFCNVLGLDPGTTKKVVLTMEAGDVVTFEAQIYAEREGVKGIGEIITKRCRIVPIAEPIATMDAANIEYQKEDG